MKKPNGEYYSFQEWDEFLQSLSDEQLLDAELETAEDVEQVQQRMISARLQNDLGNFPYDQRVYELLSTQLSMIEDERVRRSGKAV